MRHVHFFKIFSTYLFLSSLVWASESLEDSEDSDLPQISTSFLSTPPAAPLEQNFLTQKFHALDSATITLITPSRPHNACDIRILESDGGTHQMTPLMLVACYLGLKVDANKLALENARLKQENETLKNNESQLLVQNAILSSHNEQLQKDMLLTHLSSQALTEKNSALEKEKEKLAEDLNSLQVTNAFLKQNNKALSTDLALATQSAEKLVKDKSEAEYRCLQSGNNNSMLLAQLAAVIQRNGELLISNQQLMSRSQ